MAILLEKIVVNCIAKMSTQRSHSLFIVTKRKRAIEKDRYKDEKASSGPYDDDSS